MSDYLINHAVTNVWCTPNQDLQVTYRPQRISNPRGVRERMSHMWGSVFMPTATDVYHVYQIGQYQPFLIGLSPVRGKWRSLADLMNEESLFSDLYTVDGIHLSRFHTFVMVTPEQNVLVAVRDQAKIVNLKTAVLYLRLYSNSFFNSPRSDDYAHGIVCRGARVMTSAQALNVQRDYLEMKARPRGYTWLYVNGVYRDDYRPADFQAGDYVEFVHDSSVKAVKEFNIRDLPTFDSIKDSKRKYLLHYAGNQVGGVGIDYRDDIDLYLIKPAANNRYTGVYYHKNNDDAFRQVTHRDYSMVVDYVVAHQQAMLPRGWTNINDLKVQMFIRHGGYSRPLVFEHHRIQELYKLPDANIRQALLGLDSVVDVWRADQLENSEYIEIMDARKRQITIERVKEAYGYNAIAKLIGDTPSKVQNMSGRRAVSLPYGTQVDSTAYEIDSAGKLIASYIHTSGVEYTPFNANCAMVEMIIGRGGQKLDMVFNTQDVPVNPKYSYRFYIAPIAHGELRNDQWADVTGDNTKYEIINGKVHWLVDLQYNAVCVKSDAFFLNYELNLPADNGLLRFTVTATNTWQGGQALSNPLYIPPGRVDVWINDEVLVEGLDYLVKWPQIVVTNKQFLRDGQTQKIRVRGTGFCNADLSRVPPKEVGFVRWGKLSRNTRYDLRDDRVVRLVVNGRTFHRDDVYFTEGDPSLWMNNVPNGAPYILEDLVVPLRQVISDDTYDFRAKSLEVDQKVSDYLTMKMPEPIPANPDPILERYAVYSPFAASVMYDLLTERLSTEKFRGQYSDQEVRTFLSSYEWLLDFEPTRTQLDLSHVAVHPHDRTTVIELDAYQYMLLNRAIKIFLEDKVDITRFVRIKASFI
ncbi:virion structural protein [Xanthomonas phage RTH11]|nr:virion structural protein [Xanthomonas phage RTH11]